MMIFNRMEKVVRLTCDSLATQLARTTGRWESRSDNLGRSAVTAVGSADSASQTAPVVRTARWAARSEPSGDAPQGSRDTQGIRWPGIGEMAGAQPHQRTARVRDDDAGERARERWDAGRIAGRW